MPNIFSRQILCWELHNSVHQHLSSIERTICKSSHFLPKRSFVLLALVCLLTHYQGASAQVHSTWINNSASADWFDASLWTNGVPINPGDRADILASRSGIGSPIVTAPLSLGELRLGGTRTVTVIGNSVITFDQPGDNPAVLGTFPDVLITDSAVFNPISIAAGETLAVEVADGATMELEGSISTADGNLTKRGGGQFVLSGDNSAWQGTLTLAEGDLKLEHVSALGDTTGPTRITGGRLLIGDDPLPPRGVPPFDLGGPLSEPFILEGGVLETTGLLDLQGSIEVASGNQATLRGPFSLRAGSHGAGNLHIVATQFTETSVFDAPLAHAGGVNLSSGESSQQFARFDIDNSYGGPTSLRNIRLNVRTPGGLGTADAGTLITAESDLRLHGGSAEDVTVVDSRLSLWSAETTLTELRATGKYSLHNSVLTTYGDFRGAANYVVEQPIGLSGDTNSIETERGALTIAGGITGVGDLILEPDFFPINIASPINHTGTIELQDGPVHFLAGTQYDGEITLNTGGMVVETDLMLPRISTSRPRLGSSVVFGDIEVAPGASLQVERLEIQGGFIRGSIETTESLLFAFPYSGLTVSNVDTGLEYHLLSGQTRLDDSHQQLSATNGAFHIDQPKFTSLLLGARSVTDANFHLNNGSGFNFGGAILLESDSMGGSSTTIRGDIHLGQQGAHIGGQEQEVRVEGQITGGDLNLGRRRSTPGLQLVGGEAAYTGATRIFSGAIGLSEAGRLSNTSHIEIYSGGALYLDSSVSDGQQADRLADDVPIRLYGGEVSAWPSEIGVDTVERIGNVHAAGGLSSLGGYQLRFRGNLFAEAKLLVEDLTRDPGAVVMVNPTTGRNFDINQSGGSLSLNLENPPPTTNGILPAWLLFGTTQFATYGAEGVQPYQGPTEDILVADETSIVRPSTNLLDRDLTIHAWSGFGNTPTVDMQTRTLTVGSGGLLGAKLSNGRIEPGEHANGELIFSGGFDLDVEIADSGRPTSVTYATSGEIRGNHTYTGTTYIIGGPSVDVRVTRASALPFGGDFIISGHADLNLAVNEVDIEYQLGDIVLRDGGSITNSSNEPTLEAESLLIEAGSIQNLALAGNFSITKRTEGYAELHRLSPEYSGKIDVLEGTLQLGNASGPGHLAFHSSSSAEVIVHPSARLALAPAGEPATGVAPTPTINLAGGDLLSAAGGPNFQTNFFGDVHVTGHSTAYAYDAREDQPMNRRLQIDGAYRVASGASLTVVGFDLVATEGIHLAPDAALAGTGNLNANVEFADGAILSPGLIGEKVTVGTLTTDCCQTALSWGEGGRYRWEVNDATGVAGAPVGRGWDMLLLGGQLTIDSTPQAPFIIEPISLTNEGEVGKLASLMPFTNYRWLIAEIGTRNAHSATISGFTPDKFAFDLAALQQVYPQITADHFFLELNDVGMHLRAITKSCG